MTWLDTIILFLGSLLANTLAALSGGGAGLLQFPLLIFLDLPFGQALATHKVASVALGLGAALTHVRSGQLPLKFALYLTLTGAAGAVVGANLILHISTQFAETLLGVMILALGVYSRIQAELGQQESPQNRTVFGFTIGALGLFMIGVTNGSLTAGSGLLVTLFLVRFFGFAYKQAVALTLVCVGLFWNGIGGAAVVWAGAPIYWPWLPILLLSSLLGGALGAKLALKQSNRTIKLAFELLTVLVGLKLLFS
ncbi:sulfite exporter TauE/SafE family protein [Vibrio sp. SM6]|uniref:Probable membrane transporter protein n=1 Tax=Vibrio agarilyticus TaxID=2726741 RepID=A0A7X8YF86_9VIBR|nr:sulfite exporter TauE/SafE family protein [Vibrio agarilyticus]NLS11603.1 sulfite exporter TauE/SafE family protein [Vibrio agarilyticus]